MTDDVYKAIRGMEAMDGNSVATQCLTELVHLCATIRGRGSGLVAATSIFQVIIDTYNAECDEDGFRE